MLSSALWARPMACAALWVAESARSSARMARKISEPFSTQSHAMCHLACEVRSLNSEPEAIASRNSSVRSTRRPSRCLSCSTVTPPTACAPATCESKKPISASSSALPSESSVSSAESTLRAMGVLEMEHLLDFVGRNAGVEVRLQRIVIVLPGGKLCCGRSRICHNFHHCNFGRFSTHPRGRQYISSVRPDQTKTGYCRLDKRLIGRRAAACGYRWTM